MRAVLNHSEMEVRTEKPKGIGIVQKEKLPSYRMAIVESCQNYDTYDPKF
jgi:hypothetical protein